MDRSGSENTTAGPMIVAIGASAGGLNALELFFENMPVDTGMAFVVIQHLSPDFKSLMDDLLARRTSMPIHIVTNQIQLEPNSIYLAPPRYQMTLSDNTLLLSEKAVGQHLDLPIDFFLRSLAEEAREKAIAIILSGTGSDGSRGIQNIRTSGGLVLVQSPETAQFDGMPRNALATGAAHGQFAPEKMPKLLVEYQKDPSGILTGMPLELEIFDDEGEYAEIFALLRRSFNLDFSRYKATTVGRRIQRRMAFRQISNSSEYAAILSENKEEIDSLYADLLIGVTEFFRDPHAFEYLETRVLPDLFRGLTHDDEIRVWSAACATGEEAYSLAILLTEKAEKMGFLGKITVFATDVHHTSLETASAGVYSAERLANLSPERIIRFFRKEGSDFFKVNPDLRKMVVVAPHNLISDPPFTKIDLICCRNFLIYLQPEAQDNVISMFHFALKVGGVLFLGNSEGLGQLTGEFESMEAHHKIYRKTANRNVLLDFGRTRYYQPRMSQSPDSTFSRTASLDRQILHDYDVILKNHVPPGVLVNDERQVLHFFGNVAEYLRPPVGRADNDILHIIDEALHIPVSTGIQRVQKNRVQVVTKNIRFRKKDEDYLLDIVVDPIYFEKTRSCHYHIFFDRVREIEPPLMPEAVPENSTFVFNPEIHFQQHMADLELELQTTKESLQATIEELQTSNEELQATNEELLAANEELQSTNEELHSVNEELYTVNSEFERKNNELKQLNLDYDNLLASTETGTIFLDVALCIRKFNPAIQGFFKLLPHDMGRPIADIAYHLAGHQEMLDSARKVLETGEIVETEQLTPGEGWVLIRMLPFRDDKVTVGGVVITFTDITKIKNAERGLARLNEELERKVLERTEALRRSEETFRTIFTNVNAGVFLTDLEGHLLQMNDPLLRMFGQTRDDMPAAPDIDTLIPLGQSGGKNALRSILNQEIQFFKTRVMHVLPESRVRWFELTMNPISNGAGAIESFVGILVDITAQINDERRARSEEYRFETVLALNANREQPESDIFDEALSAALALTESPIGFFYFYDEDTKKFTVHAWSREVMKECTIRKRATEYHLDKTGLWGEIVRQRRPILVNTYENHNPLKRGYPEGHVPLQRFLSVPVFESDRIVAVVGVGNKPEVYDEFDERQLALLMQGIWDIIQRKRAEELLKAEKAKLEDLNTRLKKTVEEEVTKNREKDRLMIIQGRQAAMGEMIGAIAHQWRQPINTVGIILQDLRSAHDHGGFTPEYLDKNISDGMGVIQHMSSTIDDFRNFFRPDKAKQHFPVNERIQKAISFIEPICRNQKIHLDFRRNGEIFVVGFQNEYAQVILNILNNAKDALIERGIVFPRIAIISGEESGKSVVTITDNAGGISRDILDRIFDPYFTTKDEGKGTGIGLYMSKNIIESMQGSLLVRNVEGGAEFKIEV